MMISLKKTQLNVLHVIDHFGLGGAANATYYILKEFSGKDIEVDLVTTSPTGKFEQDRMGENITIHKLPVRKKRIHYWTQKEVLSYSWKAYRYIKRLKEERKYDLIHAFFGIPCGAIAYRFRKEMPYVVSLRGSDVPGFNERFSFQYVFLKPIIRRIWRNAKAVVANSQGLKELALKTDKNVKIDIIYNGINIEDFPPKEYGRNNEVVILTVARLIKRKGIDDLIRAIPSVIKEYKDIKVRIIGEGNMEKELKDLAEKLGVSEYIEFLGYIPHDRISKYYSSSDIFVLPSKNEGMSNTVLEAMTSGLPIITTDTGGTTELIDDNGIIVPIGNSGAISRAIIEYVRNPELIKEHGSKSRSIAENMDWSKVAGEYYKLYEKIV